MLDLPELSKNSNEGQIGEPPQKTLVSRIIEGTLSIGLATVSAMTLGLITTMVVVRRLPPDDFGIFVLLVVSSVFLSEASSFGLTLAVPTFIAGTEDQRQRSNLMTTAIFFRLLTIALLSAVILIARPIQLILPDSSNFLEALVYVPLLFGLDGLGKSFRTILQGSFRFKIIGSIDLLSSVSNFLLVIVFVLLLGQGLTGLIHAKVISLAASVCLAFFFILRQRMGTFRIDLLKNLLVFGFPLELQFLLNFVFLRVDTFIIGTMLGPAGIAYYEVARRIPDSINQLYEAFRMVYFPFAARLFARNEFKELGDLLNHSVRALSFLTMLGALISFLFGNEILSLLFSEGYLPSVPAFVILMIGLNLSFTENTLGYSLVDIGQSDKPLIVNLARTTISIASNLLLIPGLGFVGAALANVISNLVAIPLDLFFLHKRSLEMKAADYLKPVGMSATCALIVLVLGLNHYLFKSAMLIGYLVGCILLSVITIADMATIWKELMNIVSRLARRYRPGGKYADTGHH